MTALRLRGMGGSLGVQDAAALMVVQTEGEVG